MIIFLVDNCVIQTKHLRTCRYFINLSSKAPVSSFSRKSPSPWMPKLSSLPRRNTSNEMKQLQDKILPSIHTWIHFSDLFSYFCSQTFTRSYLKLIKYRTFWDGSTEDVKLVKKGTKQKLNSSWLQGGTEKMPVFAHVISSFTFTQGRKRKFHWLSLKRAILNCNQKIIPE